MKIDFDSILHQYQSTYYKLPPFVKKFIGSLYGTIPIEVRFGKNYVYYKKIIEKFENASEQFQLDYQFSKTLETLQFAYDHIPFYRDKFDAYGLRPSIFRSPEDIKKFPKLTKQEIQEHLDTLYTDKFDKPVPYYTGGSSSTPVKLYSSRSVSRSKEKAYFLNSAAKTGYRYREPTVTFMARGKPDEAKHIYWEYQKIDNFLLVSVNHLKEDFIPYIMAEIDDFKPSYFYGYVSAITTFVAACKNLGIKKLDFIKGLILVSESVSTDQILFLKKFFVNAEVVTHYGHTERVTMADRVNDGAYTFSNSYGLTRVVHGEIVGTSFDNIVMPYINYRTKDYVLGEIQCYKNTDIIQEAQMIQGRLQEFLVTTNHTLIPLLRLSIERFGEYGKIRKTQFCQDTPGKVVLRIEGGKAEDIKMDALIELLRKETNHDIEFQIEFVDQIENTHRRKHRMCIQKLDIEEYMQSNRFSY